MDQVTIARWFRYSSGLRALGYDFSAAHYTPLTRLCGVGRSQFLRYQQGLSRRLWHYLSRLQPPPS
jgi:hypothetical protein